MKCKTEGCSKIIHPKVKKDVCQKCYEKAQGPALSFWATHVCLGLDKNNKGIVREK